MNELITKLWEEAAQRDDIWQPRHEKFAELIIKECDLYARGTWEHGELLGGDLKRLFGVEL